MIQVISFYILCYFALLWVCYTILFLTSIPRIIRKFQEIHFSNVIQGLVYPHGLDITVMMPVRNYEQRIGMSIDAVLNNHYPNTFLIVVNDGSTDGTLKQLIKRYKLKKTSKSFRNFIQTSEIKQVYQSTLYPHFLVVDKLHDQRVASAADVLNVALNLCRTPLCVTIDGDTIIMPDTLTYMVYAYLTTPNCAAVGGDIFIPDESKNNQPIMNQIPKNPTLGVQVVEYLRSFIYGHEFWGNLGGALCHSGALTLFETKRLIELGGFDVDNFSYDAEIIMRLHHHNLKNKMPYHIRYSPSAIAWSAQPTTLKGLWSQRNRWQRGLLRSLGRHMSMLFNPQFGRVGMMGMPFYVLFEIFGPLVEGIAYLTLLVALCIHQIDLHELVWFLLLAWAYIFILSVSSVLINYLTPIFTGRLNPPNYP